jgi:hypothetical protein
MPGPTLPQVLVGDQYLPARSPSPSAYACLPPSASANFDPPVAPPTASPQDVKPLRFARTIFWNWCRARWA